jgi:hypothetical protein
VSNSLLAVKLGHGLEQFGKHFVLPQQVQLDRKVFKALQVLLVQRVQQVLKVLLAQQDPFLMLLAHKVLLDPLVFKV